jgi:hypothetical protein
MPNLSTHRSIPQQIAARKGAAGWIASSSSAPVGFKSAMVASSPMHLPMSVGAPVNTLGHYRGSIMSASHRVDSTQPFLLGAHAQPPMQISSMPPQAQNAASRGPTPQLHTMRTGMQASAAPAPAPAASFTMRLQQQAAAFQQQQPHSTSTIRDIAQSLAKKPRLAGPNAPAQHGQHVAMALQQHQTRPPQAGGGGMPAAAHHMQRTSVHTQSPYGIQSQQHPQQSAHAGIPGTNNNPHAMPSRAGLVGAANGIHHHQADTSRVQQQHRPHQSAPTSQTAQLSKPLILGLPTLIGNTSKPIVGSILRAGGSHMPGGQISAQHHHHQQHAPYARQGNPPSAFPAYAGSMGHGTVAAHMAQKLAATTQLGKRRFGA